MGDDNFDITTMLNHLVLTKFITEWQAGYITGMLNYIETEYGDNEFNIRVNYERVYKKLLLFILSYSQRKES